MRDLLRSPLRLGLALLTVLLAGGGAWWLNVVYPLNNEFRLAAAEGDLTRMARLRQRGANPDARTEALWTPLTQAAERGDVRVASALLDFGADPHRAEGGGNTALFYAALNGHLPVVELLLARGADPNRRGGSAKNLSPLAIAERSQRPEVVARLRAAGAKPEAP